MSLALSGNLVLVGAGKMGGAMLEGWLKSGADPKKVIVLDPFAADEMKALLARHGVSLNPAIAGIANAEVILIAVKPQMMEEVLPAIVGLGASKPLILSVAAGSGKPRVRTSDMKGPIWRGGKLTTAATWRPSRVSGV